MQVPHNNKNHNRSMIINNKLLNPQDRLVRLPMDIWLKQLNAELSRFDFIKTNGLDLLAAIGNQVGLLYCYQNRYDEAEQCCKNLIQSFNAISVARQSASLLHYTIQPWINLGRLARLEKKYDMSVAYFKFLKKENFRRHVKCHISSIIQDALIVVKEMDNNTQRVIDFVYINDIFNSLVEANRYHDAQIFVDQQRSGLSSGYDYILDEMSVICLSADNNINQALDIAHKNSTDSDAFIRAIFTLRKVQLYIANRNIKESKTFCQFLLGYAHALSKDDMQDYNKCNLVTHIAQTLFQVGEVDEANVLFKKSYVGFYLLNDELGLLNTLNNLSVLDYERLDDIFQERNSIVQNSGYYFIRDDKITPTHFVEKLRAVAQMLFEKLEALTVA